MNKATDNAFLNFTTDIIALVTGSVVILWMTPYLINRLGVEVYGVVPLFGSFMVYIGLVTMVLTSAVGRFASISYHKGDIRQAAVYVTSSFWGLLGLSAITFLLLLIFSLFLDKVFNMPVGYESQARWLFLLIVGSTLFAGVNSTFGASLFILHKFFLMDIGRILSKFLQVAVIVIGFRYVSISLVWVGWGALSASLFVLLLTALFASWLLPELRISSGKFDFGACREMAGMGFGVLINQFGALLYLSSDLIVINLLLGTVATGRYGPILQWVILVRTIAFVVTRLFGPVIMELIAKEDYETLKSQLFRLIKMVGLIIGLPICLASGFSKPLLGFWLGDGFMDLYKLMVLLMLGQILPYSLGTIFGVFRGLNTLKAPGRVTLLAGLCNIILSVFLIKYTPLGIYGAGIATVIAVFGKSVLYNVIYLSKLLKFNPWKIWLSVTKGCVPAAIFTVIIFIFCSAIQVDNVFKLAGYGVLFSVIYSVVSFKYILCKSEREFFLRVLKLDKFLPHGMRNHIVK